MAPAANTKSRRASAASPLRLLQLGKITTASSSKMISALGAGAKTEIATVVLLAKPHHQVILARSVSFLLESTSLAPSRLPTTSSSAGASMRTFRHMTISRHMSHQQTWGLSLASPLATLLHVQSSEIQTNWSAGAPVGRRAALAPRCHLLTSAQCPQCRRVPIMCAPSRKHPVWSSAGAIMKTTKHFTTLRRTSWVLPKPSVQGTSTRARSGSATNCFSVGATMATDDMPFLLILAGLMRWPVATRTRVSSSRVPERLCALERPVASRRCRKILWQDHCLRGGAMHALLA